MALSLCLDASSVFTSGNSCNISIAWSRSYLGTLWYGREEDKEKKPITYQSFRVINFIFVIDLNFILLVFITSNFYILRQQLFPLMGLFYSSAHILPLPQACLPGDIDYESVYFWQLFWVYLLERREIFLSQGVLGNKTSANNIKINIFNKPVFTEERETGSYCYQGRDKVIFVQCYSPQGKWRNFMW